MDVPTVYRCRRAGILCVALHDGRTQLERSAGGVRTRRSVCDGRARDDQHVEQQHLATLAHVRQVAPQADSNTRTFQVKVAINNPPEGMSVDAAAILSQVSGLLGALIGGGASLAVAVYNQRSEERLQRVANEVTKRETIYADFLVSASKLLLNAYTHGGSV